MDTKVKGIILKLTDIKEADKLASIFSLEQGIISANFRGIRKEKSKLKEPQDGTPYGSKIREL